MLVVLEVFNVFVDKWFIKVFWRFDIYNVVDIDGKYCVICKIKK